MGNDINKPANDVSSFRDILSSAPIMPDETQQDYDAFQAAMLSDLGPKSAYANVIADSIIANEWELYRLRRWFGKLMLARGERRLTTEILDSVTEETAASIDVGALAKAAMSNTSEQVEALKALDELGIDVSKMLVFAYVGYDEGVDHFEKQISSLEKRRTRLRRDFIALNNRFRETIADAELA